MKRKRDKPWRAKKKKRKKKSDIVFEFDYEVADDIDLKNGFEFEKELE